MICEVSLSLLPLPSERAQALCCSRPQDSTWLTAQLGAYLVKFILTLTLQTLLALPPGSPQHPSSPPGPLITPASLRTAPTAHLRLLGSTPSLHSWAPHTLIP